jgi:asparagine synthase (glutamine-hydrolysing)
VRFDDPAYDESGVASRTASFLGADHHQIDCRRSDFAHRLVAAVRAGEMIQENSHGVARYLQSEGIRRHGFKVVLAGEGGDELFAGYPQFQRDLTLTLSPEAAKGARSGYTQLTEIGIPPHLQSLLTELGLVPTWILDRYMNVTQPIRRLLRDDFAARLAARNASAELLAGASHQIVGRAFVHQSMYLFAKSWFCNYILAAERLDMAHGLEVRLPFLDHQLFESVRSLPLEWYAYGGQTKFPLRAAMRPSLPVEVVDGGKRGFFAPPITDDEQMLLTLRELVGGSALKENPFFDQRRVEETLGRMTDCGPRERGRFERLLQIVAGTCVLGHEFGMVA